MKTPQSGLDLIKHYEGWSAKPYLDPVNIPTIGYGSIWDANGDRVTMAHPQIDKAAGEALLACELAHVERAIGRLIRAPLTENQFAALASFTYNLGSGRLQSSTLRMLVNRGDYAGAADEFPKWRRAGGKILLGLVRRRADERELWLTSQ